MIKRSEHRVVCWAGNPGRHPVTCACGYKTFAKTRAAAYAAKNAHLKENS